MKQPKRVKTGVICLIDGAYLLSGSKSNIDMLELRCVLQKWSISEYGHFDRTIYFNSMKMGDEKQEKFHSWLQSKGFEVKLFGLKEMDVKCPCCDKSFKRQVQKGVDVAIATYILELADQYKRLVLVAGDGDLIHAVRVVQNKFKEVYVSGFHGSMSGEFRVAADKLKILNM